MSVLILMPVRTEKLKQLQDVVKQTNGRFVGKHFLNDQIVMSMNSVHVQLEFEIDDYRKFSSSWQTVNDLNIVETSTPKWKRLMRRAFSVFK